MKKKIFRLFAQKRKQLVSSDTLNVILKTERILSEAQKNTIINIVKDGIRAGEDQKVIVTWIILATDLNGTVIFNKIAKNEIEVIF